MEKNGFKLKLRQSRAREKTENVLINIRLVVATIYAKCTPNGKLSPSLAICLNARPTRREKTNGSYGDTMSTMPTHATNNKRLEITEGNRNRVIDEGAKVQTFTQIH